MNLIYFILVAVAIFMTVLLGGKKYRNTALYALAIGGAVNANFFHAGNYPINCFNLPFGIDSIIYTLFVFCVIMMYYKEGKNSAYLLTVSSVIAIVLSSVMQLISDLLSNGNNSTAWYTFLTFLISSIATIIAIVIMLESLDKLKNKTNKYILLIIGIVIATVINSGIYYPLSALINGTPANIWKLLISSFIGKFISMAISLFTLFILTKMDNNKESD